jgi:hypothetical protein
MCDFAPTVAEGDPIFSSGDENAKQPKARTATPAIVIRRMGMLTKITTACALAKAPTTISQDDAQPDPMGHRVLYVLGFGLAGAILANMLVFIYFISFYAPG